MARRRRSISETIRAVRGALGMVMKLKLFRKITMKPQKAGTMKHRNGTAI